MIHDLKTWPYYYHVISRNLQNFDVRNNDRRFTVGDTLRLREWNGKKEEYTGRSCLRKVTYILDEPDFVKEGFVVMGIKAEAKP